MLELGVCSHTTTRPFLSLKLQAKPWFTIHKPLCTSQTKFHNPNDVPRGHICHVSPLILEPAYLVVWILITIGGVIIPCYNKKNDRRLNERSRDQLLLEQFFELVNLGANIWVSWTKCWENTTSTKRKVDTCDHGIRSICRAQAYRSVRYWIDHT